MTRFWLSCSITLLASTAAAEPPGHRLPTGSVCILPDPAAAVTMAPPPDPSPLEIWISAPSYVITRDDAERILVERKAGRQAIDALRARDQEDSAAVGDGGSDYLPWLVAGGVTLIAAALVGGIFAGVEVQKAEAR